MAITVTPSTYFEYRKQQGQIDLVNDTIKAALMDDAFSFDRDKHKAFSAPQWQSSTVYQEGDTVAPIGSTAGDQYVMLCIDHSSGADGLSGSNEPAWPTGATDPFGNTVVDNDLTWEVWSYDTALEEITDAGDYVQEVLTMLESGSGQVEDETNDLSYVAYDDIVFQAGTSGDFDPSAGCVMYDDTDPQKTIIAGIEFGTAYTVTVGNNMTLKNPEIQSKSIQITI